MRDFLRNRLFNLFGRRITAADNVEPANESDTLDSVVDILDFRIRYEVYGKVGKNPEGAEPDVSEPIGQTGLETVERVTHLNYGNGRCVNVFSDGSSIHTHVKRKNR